MAAQSGGSAPGYQPGFALSALQETADVRVTDPYIYAAALAGQPSASAALCKEVFGRFGLTIM